eukprot:4414381-Pyramimonas_sp.AAC.1
MSGGAKKRKLFVAPEDAAAALAEASSHDSAHGAGPDRADAMRSALTTCILPKLTLYSPARRGGTSTGERPMHGHSPRG